MPMRVTVFIATLVVSGLASPLLLNGVAVAQSVANPSPQAAIRPAMTTWPAILSPRAAHAAAGAGDVVLIDIRTADEWRTSGVPVNGYAISMHQAPDAFFKELAAATGGSKSKPVALICASGNRSAALIGQIKQAGYASVIDVSEGMTGGPRGAGWIRSGLPVRVWSPGRGAPDKTTP
jgi:rhodanese-related sulfurtransferase